MAGYLGASPVPQTIQKKQSFTATASQTTFTTTGYTDGAFINVYLNGVRLINGTDYQATNGSDIVLTTGASASDVLDFETFNEFTLVDQTLETPTFRTSATLKNDTEEDTDGGRESTLIFKGEQSGGEISTLAQIQASHDGTSDDQKGDLIFKTNDGSDNDAPTEAARIDSSQNFLVSTTGTDPNNATSSSDAGAAIRSDGRVLAGVYQDFVADLNRIDNDGEIVRLSKDGTTVGSIGVTSSRMFTGTGDVGLFFNDQTDQIQPWNTSTNASRDDAITLGTTNRRFKNLYLSGGAYLGGTGAANKLEDYEEGTFTGTIGGHTTAGTQSGTISGKYVKVGTLIHCSISMSAVSLTGASGRLQISGMPFTAASGGSGGGTAQLEGFTPSYTYTTGSGNHIQLYVSGSVLVMRAAMSAAWDNYLTTSSTFTGGGGSTYGLLSVTYHTN
jgi:hypothetical protein